MLHLTIPKVQAWERLNDPDFCGNLTMDQLYELFVEAGYSEGVAQEAARQRGWDRLCAGIAM